MGGVEMEKQEILDNLYWTLGVIKEISKNEELKGSYNYEDAVNSIEDDKSKYVNKVCRIIQSSKVINILFRILTGILLLFIGYKMELINMIWTIEDIFYSLCIAVVTHIIFIIVIIFSQGFIKNLLIDRILLSYIDRGIWNKKSKKYNYKEKYEEVIYNINKDIKTLKNKSLLHYDYCDMDIVNILIKYFEHGRVTTLKEAINKYWEETIMKDLIESVKEEY